MFISFEGIDGSGKTTLSETLAESLAARNIRCVISREPGGDPAGEAIRNILLSPDCRLPLEAEFYLFLASRCVNAENLILPALGEGRVVISDRFYDSIIAYQCCGKGFDRDTAKALHAEAVSGLVPDVTFLLDISVEDALKRNQARDRFSDNAVFLEKVRQGYLELAREDPGRVVVIDAMLPLEDKLRVVLKKLTAMGMEEIL